MERLMSRHGLTGWVELTGRLDRDQLRDVYRRADVFVAPARLESFGIAALEARTAGLPVVAMARAGIREFVLPEVEGLLADGDRGMAAAITRLAVDASLRTSIAAHNRAVLPSMTWPSVLERCEAAYRRAGSLVGAAGREGDVPG
jgi:glycosyltransferase involved in cell wall biosynthesis